MLTLLLALLLLPAQEPRAAIYDALVRDRIMAREFVSDSDTRVRGGDPCAGSRDLNLCRQWEDFFRELALAESGACDARPRGEVVRWAEEELLPRTSGEGERAIIADGLESLQCGERSQPCP
ncbi:MAG: hypothetical protein M3416_21345 [Acidobacteriota bacterium]|nr:hypothetical protein [Acidobacteriota bacterium]